MGVRELGLGVRTLCLAVQMGFLATALPAQHPREYPRESDHPGWKELYRAAGQALEEGDYERAETLALRSLRAAEERFGRDGSRFQHSLSVLRGLYSQVGQPEKTENLLLAFLRKSESEGGRGSLWLLRLASHHAELKQEEKCRQYARFGLEWRLSNSGETINRTQHPS